VLPWVLLFKATQKPPSSTMYVTIRIYGVSGSGEPIRVITATPTRRGCPSGGIVWHQRGDRTSMI
jgi:hypothetical protein